MNAKDAIVKVLQEALEMYREARESLGCSFDQLLAVALGERSSAVEGVGDEGTPPLKLPCKRSWSGFVSSEASATESTVAPVDLPCRGDLSHWAVSRLHRDEVESRAGKRQKVTYVYGNYPNYYKYRRLSDTSGNEPRIQSFKKEWFCGKDCLDVGSHIGILPLEIVLSFLPRSMMGIEIDATLHDRAWQMRSELIQTYRRNEKNDIVQSLKKTRFVHGDVLQLSNLDGSVDVLTCLSVSKWIHFHHGDDGMRQLFQMFWNLLRDDGLLIFEPQPLKSYQRAFHKQDMTSVPFLVSEMQFLPDDFLSYLMEVIGFEMVESVRLDETARGFERPLYVLKKPHVLSKE